MPARACLTCSPPPLASLFACCALAGLPPGSWFDLSTGSLRAGPLLTPRRRFHLADMPVFAIGGSVVGRRGLPPSGSLVGLAAAAYDAIEWTVHPGSQSSSGGGRLYEDDGETTRYLPAEGAQFVWINTSYAWEASGANLTLKVDPDEGGGYEGRPLQRSHTFRLPLTLPPSSVSLDGKELPYAPVWRARGKLGDPSFRGAWTYDGDQLATPDRPAGRPFGAGYVVQKRRWSRVIVSSCRAIGGILSPRRTLARRTFPSTSGSPSWEEARSRRNLQRCSRGRSPLCQQRWWRRPLPHRQSRQHRLHR